MTEYIVLKHPELKIWDGNKLIKDFRYAINMEGNEIKVYEEVEDKLYEDSGNHHSVGALLDFISQPFINRPYVVEIYKKINECEVENEQIPIKSNRICSKEEFLKRMENAK